MPTTKLDWVGARLVQGRYHIMAHLGEGGMGQVYKARDRKLGSDVVIKVPRPALLQDPEFAARFKREVRALVRLEHPHIVKVIDVDEHEGVPFAVMAYLAGGSLEDRLPCDRNGNRVAGEPGQLGAWLADVSSALDFVHKQRFIHRDVKPANILFDGQGHVFLSDFGVAKAVAETTKSTGGALTGTGVVLGTPAYLAPEMALGKPFDHRADQYSLASSIYELLGGRVPFEGPTPAAVLLKQTNEAPPRLETLNRTVSRPLADAIHKALAKDPAERYPSCTAFAKAVCATLPPEELDSIKLLQKEVLRTDCPSCGKSCRLPALAQGRRVRCPACQSTFQAPDHRPAKSPGQVDTRPNVAVELDTKKLAFAAERPAPGTRAAFPLVPLLVAGAAAVVVLGALGIGLLLYLASKPEHVAKEDLTAKTSSPQKKLPELTLSHSKVTLKPGESTKLHVAITRNGHEGAIELDITGLPRPVRPTVPNIGVANSAADLELSADADALATETTALITAKVGNVSVSDRCRVAVLAGSRTPSEPMPPKDPTPPPSQPSEPATGSFRILPIADLDLEIGSGGKITVTVERVGYAGAIDLKLSQHPWIRGVPTQIPAGKDAAYLTLLVDAQAAPRSKVEAEPILSVTASALNGLLKSDKKEFVARLKRRGTPQEQPPPFVPPENPTSPLTNDIGMKMVWIKPGRLQMGSPPTERGRDAKDEDLHDVTLTRGYYLGIYEVTQEEYLKVMGDITNPSRFKDTGLAKKGDFSPAGGKFTPDGRPARLPVENVTWEQAQEFCRRLTAVAAERAAGRAYRLPTEAEWEYACRAETQTIYPFGTQDTAVGDYAWYHTNSQGKTQPVGTKKPNGWGLFDMQGNVGEWCADWYDENYYKNFIQTQAVDPQGPKSGAERVVRGGGWTYDTTRRGVTPFTWLRSAHRLSAEPGENRKGTIGFRVACDLVAPMPSDKIGTGQPIPRPPK